MRNPSHPRTPFLPRLCHVTLPPRLMGFEEEVKGGRGQQGMMVLSTFDKAAVTDILGRNSLESLVKLLLFQSMPYEILHAYLEIKA